MHKAFRKLQLVLLPVLLAAFIGIEPALAASSLEREYINRGFQYLGTTANVCADGPTNFRVESGTVYVLGDSIANGARDAIAAEFSHPWSTIVNAQDGRSTRQAIGAAREDADQLASADVVVVHLGANDSSTSFRSAQKTLIDEIRAINQSARLYWVNTGSNTNGVGKDGNSLPLNVDEGTPLEYSQINRTITGSATPFQYSEIDWFREVFPSGDPADISAGLEDVNNYLQNDKLHPNSDGNVAYAALLRQQLERSSGVRGLPPTVPEPYNEIFTEAGEKFGVEPALIATTFYTENQSFREPPPPYGDGKPWPVSGADARGPFQFLDGTWGDHGQDGNNDGRIDVNDLYDAAYGAADYLRWLRGPAGTPLGNPDPNNPYTENHETLVEVWIGYNWGPGNVWGTSSSPGSRLPLPNETTKYIKIASDKYLELTQGTAIANLAVGQCSSLSGGIGVSSDGFVFPLITTKTALATGSDVNGVFLNWRPTGENVENIHHNYNAADIFVDTGTPVVAAKAGFVLATKNVSGGVGSRITIRGKDDGNVYYYAHLLNGSISHTVGDDVQAGEKIGEVGTNADAVGTPRHLHIDILPSEFNGRVGCSGSACREYPFIPIQPLLSAAYESLPE